MEEESLTKSPNPKEKCLTNLLSGLWGIYFHQTILEKAPIAYFRNFFQIELEASSEYKVSMIKYGNSASILADTLDVHLS